LWIAWNCHVLKRKRKPSNGRISCQPDTSAKCLCAVEGLKWILQDMYLAAMTLDYSVECKNILLRRISSFLRATFTHSWLGRDLCSNPELKHFCQTLPSFGTAFFSNF
jgi:hypothetical protein